MTGTPPNLPIKHLNPQKGKTLDVYRGRMIWGFTASPPPTAGCVRMICTSQSKKSILEHAGCRSSGRTDTGHWRYGWSGPIEMGGDGLVDLAMHRSRVIRVKTIPSYC